MQNNVHPVYGAGIWTHNLHNMSLHPEPLVQGSRSKQHFVMPLIEQWSINDIERYRRKGSEQKCFKHNFFKKYIL